MKRILIVLALGALAVPGGARADTSFAPPYQAGPRGGDMWNQYRSDPATGEMAVLRLNPIGLTTGLGCGGSGGYDNFKITPTLTEPADTVTVSYENALVDPYTWFNVGVREGESFVGSKVVRGPVTGTSTIELELDRTVSGPVEIWFGIQVASACPNIDGGTATFTGLTLSDRP